MWAYTLKDLWIETDTTFVQGSYAYEGLNTLLCILLTLSAAYLVSILSQVTNHSSKLSCWLSDSGSYKTIQLTNASLCYVNVHVYLLLYIAKNQSYNKN